MYALLMISTTGSEKEARRIARSLVEERLAACANVIPGYTHFSIGRETLPGERGADIDKDDESESQKNN